MGFNAADRVVATLLTKSQPNRERAGKYTRGHKYYKDPILARKRISDKAKYIWSLTPEEREARRRVQVLHRARWLTNAIVIQDHRQVFDVAVPSDDGGIVRVKIVLAEDATPLEFLLAVMRHSDAPLVMRLDAAKTAAMYIHSRKATLRIEESGKISLDIKGGLPPLPGTNTVMPDDEGYQAPSGATIDGATGEVVAEEDDHADDSQVFDEGHEPDAS